MAAARSGPFLPCDSKVFRKKMGRDLRPLFGPGNPAQKMGFTSLFNANADSAGRVAGPRSGQESGHIFFVNFVFPGVFPEAFQRAGRRLVDVFLPGSSWMTSLGHPRIGTSALRPRGPREGASPRFSVWPCRAGGFRLGFDSGAGGRLHLETPVFCRTSRAKRPRGQSGGQSILCVCVCVVGTSAFRQRGAACSPPVGACGRPGG
jgi:hypothetical protein